MEFAGDPELGGMGANDVLGAVVGSGVDDDPVVDVFGNTIQNSRTMGFLLHDHVEADRRARIDMLCQLTVGADGRHAPC